MPFDIHGPNSHCAIGFAEEAIFALPERFGFSCPVLMRLSERFYEDTSLWADDILQLRKEMTELHDAYMDGLLRRKVVTAREPSVRARISADLSARDPLCVVLDAIRAVCDDALASGEAVQCCGD